ncbi:macro domain-containing protein [Spirochaeta thermophila]|uniref:Macro domain-containing protein n=1 Tax=Winmispira thermophila (strain ATCC 49972 / DSM 6192 / RI 19.B1) TaxID=665571 RepID=E0RQR0_WINT6|nr:macro domain-containing protein [Spirochaeta thermophila]ADN02966.1 hypothetical protein STHERM_c20310 [Spirochaeta thermophila DSM 6192]
MARITYRDIVIETRQGDIASQPDLEAIVNAANAMLMPGGGVAGAIHRAAGPGLAEECRKYAPIKPGEAVITGGHNLPNRYVIHTLGPVYGKDRPEADLLSRCYENSLRLCEQHRIESVGFPAISTGVFGYPMREAAEVAFATIKSVIERGLTYPKRIVFVLYRSQDQALHDEVLSRMFPSS